MQRVLGLRTDFFRARTGLVRGEVPSHRWDLRASLRIAGLGGILGFRTEPLWNGSVSDNCKGRRKAHRVGREDVYGYRTHALTLVGCRA